MHNFQPLTNIVYKGYTIKKTLQIHLKRGYINTLHEVHIIHEDNVSQCIEVFPFVKPCDCNDCKKED